ncbi:DUF2786 domain-containing protein [Bacteroides sp.]|uniref:DUF2786 domain-containing protein n=1 Tax=Bacteroides sp. TaxID=29523 RepID=UPI002A7F3A8E|nr:DUF2786 domain-containing protein [Bacteroides sp.]
MDKIIDKLKKLLALAERGYQGEADNARRILEAELLKHGLTIEDVCSDNRRERIFKYNSKAERTLLIQVILNYLGSKHKAFNESTYNGKSKIVRIELTDLEYIDIQDMYEFHKSHFRKERNRLLKDMLNAYVQKHKIFDSDPEDSDREEKDIDWEELRRIFTLSASMEDVAYRKSITK